MKRISEQIADWLALQGIEQVFTVTGGGAMFLNQALGNHKKLNCTFMHHEQGCAMAAEGYARIANKPAVVMLTTGPGAINALNGVYGAFTDSIPMIVISGQVKRETCLSFHDLPKLRQLGDQEGPTIAMASPVCKYVEIIRSPTDLEHVLPKAYNSAISGRPGPVWLDIPLDIQSSTELLNIPGTIDLSTHTLSPTDLSIKYFDALNLLRKANRPVILGGTGVRLSGTTKRLLSLIERTGIPLATAWTHDLIASDHPLFAGRPGTIGTRAGNFCLQNADFVLVLGSRLNIRQTSYNWDSFAKNAWIVQVDIDPNELNKPFVKPNQAIVADLNEFFDAFEQYLERKNLPDYSAWARWCQDIGKKYAIKNEHHQAASSPINPYVMVDRVFNQMRDNDIVVCANASACILPFQVGKLKARQRLFSNSGSASMGYDLPAAIGAATAALKKQRVICFAGDGSLQMNIQELQTVKTMKLNIIIIVINNNGYLSIWQTHENFFGKVIGATPESGVEFPNFVALAHAYGIPAVTINSSEYFEELACLLEKDGPLLIDITVDPRQEFVPRIKSRVDENGRFITPELDDMYPFLPPHIIQDIRDSAKTIKAILPTEEA